MTETQRPATSSQADRPGSKGLMINGSAPPSRIGLSSAAPSTGFRARTGGEAAMHVLGQKLILKMRARFGEAAADIKGQEIISQEVMGFMTRAGAGASMKEEHMVELGNRIRAKLTGGTPRPLTMVLEKKAQVDGDEWAKIFQYSVHKGHELDRAEAQAARMRQEKQRRELDGQMAEFEAKKKAEHAEDVAYYHSEQASLRVWEAQEEARRKLQADIMRKIGQEREEQLKEKHDRILRATQRVRQDEEEHTARMAYETREELKKEEANMLLAKGNLKSFMLTNEVGKQMRLDAKQKEHAQDAVYRKQWNEILDKQELERTSRLQKNHVRQTLQALAATNRPEAKRWLDQSIIDKAYKEREEAREREEVERCRRVKEGSLAMVRRLDGQLIEMSEAKAEMRKREEDAARMVRDRAAAMEAKEQERQRMVHEAKARFRADLEAQMKANAHRRRVSPMTDVERKINTKLLDEVTDWRTSGRLSLT